MIAEKYFTSLLLEWNFRENDRQMPWKGETNPYFIWLSEIILQQTRVEQGLPYYHHFIRQYPTVHHLASAKDSDVFKSWEGLGYYSRCKNLIESARYIVKELDGVFPQSYEGILALKGIGNYTASAIASFAFGLPFAVLDGNVFRVLSRFFGIDKPIDSTEGKRIFAILAGSLLPGNQPGVYNQAIMDFGATVCKPLPLCNQCVLNQRCVAFAKGITGVLPIKANSVKRSQRWMYFLIIDYKGKLYVRKRNSKDIWQNLYEFILSEQPKALPVKQLKSNEFLAPFLKQTEFEIVRISAVKKQLLTHRQINGRFIHISIEKPLRGNGYKLVSQNDIKALPFPKFITAYLRE